MSINSVAAGTMVLGALVLSGCAQLLGLGDDPGLTPDGGQPIALTALTVDSRVLEPPFDPAITEYHVEVPFSVGDAIVIATADDAGSIEINEALALSGVPFDPVILGLGANTISVEVSDGASSTIYTLTVTRGQGLLEYIKASNTAPDHQFGFSIALDGDTLAVGVAQEDSAATGIDGDETDTSAISAGAVYVFTSDGTTWTQQAYVKASNTDAGDLFGASVALVGNTLAVGATAEDSAATDIDGDQTDNTAPTSGAVYVFTRAGATWSQEAYIKASNTAPTDSFGVSVALDGDTLAVGAVGEDSAAIGVGGNQSDDTVESAGAVYVFTREGTSWSQQAYLKASNTDALDGFGFRLALAGDTLAVGPQREDSAATGIGGDQADNSALNAGAVYVFIRSDTTWGQQAYIKASNTDASDAFGFSVALDGDTLAVGARSERSAATGIGGDQIDNNASNAGAVYVFSRTGSVWSQQAYVKASNADASDQFGFSVALDGDMLVVGAVREASSATGIGGDQTDNSFGGGATYLFTRLGTRWTQSAFIKASNTGVGDEFGAGVALDGETLVVGARNEDSSSTGIGGDQTDNAADSAGAVYIYQ